MSAWRELLLIAGIALVALAMSAAAVAGLLWAQPSHADAVFRSEGVAALVWVFAMMLGAPLVMLVGAPWYRWMRSHGRPRTWNMVQAGAVPAAAAWLAMPAATMVALAIGLSTALLTHAICQRWLTPDGSSGDASF